MKILKTLGSLIGAILDVIGVGGIHDDLVGWSELLKKWEPYIDTPYARLTLIAVGTTILLGLWRPKPPRKTRPEPHIDWSIRKALDWITFESRWGWRNFAKNIWFYPMGTPEEMRKRTYSGEVVIEGRLIGNFKFEDIDRDYWNIMQFRMDDYLYTRDLRPDMPKVRVEFRQIAHVSVPNYDEFRVSSDQIMAAWPKATWWFLWLMRFEWAGRYLLAWGKTIRRWFKHQVSR